MSIDFPEKGQINLDSKCGKFIFDLIQNNEIESVLETGTWNGCGTTRVLYEALKDKKNKKVISLETNQSFYKKAHTLYENIDWVNVLNKRIIEIEDLVQEHEFNDPRHSEWISHDISDFKETECLNIDDMNFDLCVLDSSEFGGFSEFNKIKNKCKYLVLDDSSVLKHEKTRKYCLDNFKTLADFPLDRNGWCAFLLKC